MMRHLFFLVMSFIFISSIVEGQQLKPLNIEYFQDNRNGFQQNIYVQNILKEKPIVASNTYYPLVYSPTYSLKCTLPKGAVFCRMEDAIYNRLNFWIKFRMGTDDRYSN